MLQSIHCAQQQKEIKERTMTKFVKLTISILGSMLLFGSLALYGLANEPKTTLLPVENITTTSVNTVKQTVQITFTPVATIFLPIALKPAIPINSLEISNIIPSGSDETVEIRNNGPDGQSMNGWQLVSVRGTQIFTFPNGITLGVGQTLRIHSGPDAIDNPPSDLFWSTNFLWNNNGDKAELKDDQGQVRDTLCYGDGCP